VTVARDLLREPPRIGVSACLLGRNVRYDGGHKLDHFLVDTLGRFVEFVPVCPEVEIGLGTPRPTLRLERDGRGRLHLVEPSSGADRTADMEAFAHTKVEELRALGLSGYVLKKNSPSCGMERVRVIARSGAPRGDGQGLFAAALCARMPLLPVEEEGRLGDPRRRESFVERVFAYRRLRALFDGKWTLDALARFHAAAELQVLAHAPAAYRALGRLVAAAKERERGEVEFEYTGAFMKALGRPATVAGHVRALGRAAGHLERRLDDDERRELAGAIDDFRRGRAPLVVPLTLVRHHARRHRIAPLDGQLYLAPAPDELLLRDHV
jgi:uncharacterized protein YbbK (DUF523 family)/uncharacterized protein YbgA (DUF1722 family)